MKQVFWKKQTVIAGAAFLAIWGGCVALLALSGDNFLFPIASLVVFGIVLSGLAMLLTRKTEAPPLPVARPKRESLVVLAYLLIYTLVLFGPLFGIVKGAFEPGRVQQSAVVAYKVLVHIIAPALLINAARGHLRGIFDPGLRRRGVLVTLVVFSVVLVVAVAMLNSSFEQLSDRGLSSAAIVGWILLAWGWVSVEAGVCEEFLFHGLLQSRLTAWSGSAPFAIVSTVVIYALAHVPGFYLRGGDAVAVQASGLPQIIALSIAGLGPIALMLGILWHRTRSFLLVVIVHGAIDAMPAVDKMIRIWS
ncbi:MAG TPA: CPBP family intramembrane glutamic endopeptidase [Xanthomonadaceae bacterium]|nr:CPBP family intramembrane glutamic endopeptidase [Xanthomonadaceae bacterium]